MDDLPFWPADPMDFIHPSQEKKESRETQIQTRIAKKKSKFL